ncbi:PTS system fructose-specific EIIABC component, partial [human gut metagenome]
VVKNGVDFEALDDAPVTLLFLIAAPNTEDNVHLSVLSKLSVMMMDQNFSDSLRNAGSVEEFLEIIDQADDEKKSIDERLADTGEYKRKFNKNFGSYIMSYRNCPHIYGSRRS